MRLLAAGSSVRGVVLGAVAMASAMSSLQLSRAGTVCSVLVLSVITAALKVDMPWGWQFLHLTLVRPVDLPALRSLAPPRTMLIAISVPGAVHVPDE